jgi:SOS response regulatory protein OraA/RecX
MLYENMDYPTARRTALRLLSMRSYHSAVLARKLERKGCGEEVIAQVLSDCKRMGFFNDDEAILRELKRGYGPRAIEYKLQLERGEVRKIITREMQKEKIKEMLPRLGEREKAIRTLQRKGFDFELIIEFFSSRSLD